MDAEETSARAAVHEMDLPVGKLASPPQVVAMVRVPAVDHHVPGLEVLGQLPDDRLRGFAGGDHHPHRPRGLQGRHELGIVDAPAAPSATVADTASGLTS